MFQKYGMDKLEMHAQAQCNIMWGDQIQILQQFQLTQHDVSLICILLQAWNEADTRETNVC